MHPSSAAQLWRDRVRPYLQHQWRAWRGYVLFFCFVWVPLRSSVIDYSPVPTGSMNPTILEGDVVWVDKLAYDLRVPLTPWSLQHRADPKRGDIIVVLSPAAERTRLVKRVIGIPGDTLAMHGQQLYLNGEAVTYQAPGSDYGSMIAEELRPHAYFAEEHLPDRPEHAVMGLRIRVARQDWGPVTVPPGKLFLMGDSRDNSTDSRRFGFADRNDVLGQAKGVLLSWDINDTYLPRWQRWLEPLR
ncbi:signal peptidase I [Actomonas aquatica]|uniref:Signal peptidase I n=1 Tax=Actomonas aquatica TaxID=2866162 RepID=A0ABZ1C620_9BACT|nr:signal peptidase I [Opitutus sp. WL0086]WRQ87176.1 signal peptidase I [Opitutus sp. WL0086]